MVCPYCGSTYVYFEGIDDGLGEYVDCVGDVYFCENCEQYFEGAVIPYAELEQPDTEPTDDSWGDDWQQENER